jgi:hypothetical protein
MALAIVVNLILRVLITVNVNRGHLGLELLDVIQILLRDVVLYPIKGALEAVVHGLQKQIETVKTELIPTGQDQHLPVHLVVQLVAIRAIVAAVA